MAISNIETAYLQGWGDFTGTVTASFSPASVLMQCTLSAIYVPNSAYGYITGITKYQTHNFFGGPTTHEFTSEAPWYIPNSVFDNNVMNVTFYITVWNNDIEMITALGNIFFF